jgi:hypothetical protein
MKHKKIFIITAIITNLLLVIGIIFNIIYQIKHW